MSVITVARGAVSKKGKWLDDVFLAELLDLDVDELHEALMGLPTREYLEFYPNDASEELRLFSDEIFLALQTYRPIAPDELASVRKRLSEQGRHPIRELLSDGTATYLQVTREEGDGLPTGEIEQRVLSQIPVDAPRFFVSQFDTDIQQPTYFPEEAQRVISPKQGKDPLFGDSSLFKEAFLLGQGWHVPVVRSRAHSPLIAKHERVFVPDGHYFIAPLQAYRVPVFPIRHSRNNDSN